MSNWPVTFGFGVRDRVGAVRIVRRRQPHRPRRAAAVPRDGKQHGARREPAGRRLRRRRIRSRARRGAATTSATCGSAARSTCSRSGGSSPPRSRSARWSRRRPATPTSGASTGKTDFAFDAIVSKDVNARVELSGYAGFIVRGEPDDVEADQRRPLGLRRGVSVARSRCGSPRRSTARPTRTGRCETKALLLGEDGSFTPAGFAYDMKSPVNVNLGLTWQHRSGFFAGAGWTWRANMRSRDEFLSHVHQRRRRPHGHRRAHRLSPRRPRLRAAAAAGAAAGAAGRRGRTVRPACARAASPARCSSAGRRRSAPTRRIPTATR